MVPVVHDKDDNLCEGKQKVSKVRDGLVPVVNTRKVDDVQSLNIVPQVVEERNCCTLELSRAHGDLYKTICS